MEWLKELFVEHSALQAVVVVSLISTIGIGLGKIRFFGISLGTAFIFFVGILAGHFGLSLDPAMLTYAESFGLVIFVYALGLQVGPGFFSSMRADGLRLVSPAIAIVLLGTALAMAMSYAFGVSMPDMSGILCGATTNTPAPGAAHHAGSMWSKPMVAVAISFTRESASSFSSHRVRVRITSASALRTSAAEIAVPGRYSTSANGSRTPRRKGMALSAMIFMVTGVFSFFVFEQTNIGKK